MPLGDQEQHIIFLSAVRTARKSHKNIRSQISTHEQSYGLNVSILYSPWSSTSATLSISSKSGTPPKKATTASKQQLLEIQAQFATVQSQLSHVQAQLGQRGHASADRALQADIFHCAELGLWSATLCRFIAHIVTYTDKCTRLGPYDSFRDSSDTYPCPELSFMAQQSPSQEQEV